MIIAYHSFITRFLTCGEAQALAQYMQYMYMSIIMNGGFTIPSNLLNFPIANNSILHVMFENIYTNCVVLNEKIIVVPIVMHDYHIRVVGIFFFLFFFQLIPHIYVNYYGGGVWRGLPCTTCDTS